MADPLPSVLLALALAAALGGAWWWLRDLRTLPPSSRAGAVPVSVVVPARDEEATLPALLDALQRLTTPVREVVVVDDGSRDATSAVARAAGARVVAAGAPPSGWTGKAWACHVGARATSGDLLLFLDADTVLQPGALGGLLDLHGRRGGLVSVQPFHTPVRPYEQLSAYFNAVSLLASGAFARRPVRRPMAFGPCLLTARADLERAGGHAAVRAEVLDDVALAAAYDRAGLPVTCTVGGGSVRMRSYPGGVRQLAAGWTKNIASGATAAAPAPALSAVVWLCAHHAVAVGAPLALVRAASGTSAGEAAAWVAAWLVVAGHLRWVLRRTGSFRWWTWAVFPVPLLAFDALFAVSAGQTLVRRSVRWRGREVGTGGRASAEGGA